MSIRHCLKKIENIETEKELLDVKNKISNNSFNLFIIAIIPFFLDLISEFFK